MFFKFKKQLLIDLASNKDSIVGLLVTTHYTAIESRLRWICFEDNSCFFSTFGTLSLPSVALFANLLQSSVTESLCDSDYDAITNNWPMTSWLKKMINKFFSNWLTVFNLSLLSKLYVLTTQKQSRIITITGNKILQGKSSIC